MTVGTAAAFKSPAGAIPSSVEDSLTRGVRGVGDDGQPASRHGARHDGVLHGVGEVRDQRAEIRDRGIVVECRQQRRDDCEREWAQAAEHRRDPPTLQAPEGNEAAQEEADEQRGL